MKSKTAAELNELYVSAEAEDKEVFSEMRSNIQLVAGDHYSKKHLDKYFNRIRTNGMTENQKLRLTKNHVAKIAHHYEESIMSQSPGVKIFPAIDSDMQDTKSADLNQGVWSFVKSKHKLRDKIREYCQDYTQVGEVAAKVFWDPNAGDFQGYRHKQNDDGESMYDDQNQPVADEDTPVFSGDLVFERIFGFNLLRAPGAKTMEESTFFIYRKMSSLPDLKEIYANDPDKLKYLQESSKEEFVVFDSSRNSYMKAKDQVMIREYYFKPCMEYPQGYFYISTENGILEEGELPFGLFPIVWRGFDKYPTRPRGYSVVKRARPYQAEINRASSQQATHQVTLADDKIIYQAGTKLAQGALLPGVRGVTYQGAPPTILAGRTGEQFTNYISNTITEMYQVCEMDELEEENTSTSQTDPWASLYRNIRQKKKYARYGEGFEQFLMDLCVLTLETCKKYLPDDVVIQMIGRKEQVNIQEFKNTAPISYQIRVEAMEDSLETQMGRQLSISHIMQYVGTQLPQESIGKLIKSMPFGNLDESFDDFTLDADNVKNDMLALERGTPVMFEESDNHPYYAQRLNARIKKADFRYLPQPIQDNYKQKITLHLQAEAEQQQKILDAKNSQIPTNGPMVGVDLYIEDKEDPSKPPKRARIPTTAIEWLVKQMEAQGQTMEKLEKFDQNNLATISKMLTSSPQAQGNAPGGFNGTGNIGNGGGQQQQ